MSKPIQTALLTGVLALLPLVSNAQVCNTTSIPATTPTSQLTDNGNSTVTDTKTGLMWKKCAEGQTGSTCSGTAQTYTWQLALQSVNTVNTNTFAGYSDWRLPNIKELRSIIEKQCYGPAINLTRFPNTGSGTAFWSTSPYAKESDGGIWVAYTTNGDSHWSSKSNSFQVRLVRSGQ